MQTYMYMYMRGNQKIRDRRRDRKCWVDRGVRGHHKTVASSLPRQWLTVYAPMRAPPHWVVSL